MKKCILPILIIAASLGAALAWKFCPAFRARLPAARASVTSAIERVKSAGGELRGRGSSLSTESVAPSASEPATPVVRELPSERPAAPMASKTTAPRAPASAANATAAEDELPSLLGVTQEDPMRAPWGVLWQVTEVETPSGVSKGKVAGGRFFLVESRKRTSGGLMLVGNFTPKKLDEPVCVPAASLRCFTGSPDLLSARQRECLRKFYELRAEAEEYKAKLMRENASRSPFFKAAGEAVKEFRARAKAIESGSLDMDAKRKATYELSSLRAKVQELNAKHKAWKEAHKKELPDPEKNPVYREMLSRGDQYVDPIDGMAF